MGRPDPRKRMDAEAPGSALAPNSGGSGTVKKRRTHLPPRDSWLSLGPGESVFMDAAFGKKWNEQTQAFRQVRGNFLAQCFDVEYLLDSVLCETLFPGSQHPGTEITDNAPVTVATMDILRDAFDELVLKVGSPSPVCFRFKIDLLKRLTSRIAVLESVVPKGLASRLEKIKDIRNRFAHYPVSFRPVGRPPSQDLSAELVCKDKTVQLDEAFFKKHSALRATVMSELEEVLGKLQSDTSRA
jgi:hypothetical protein